MPSVYLALIVAAISSSSAWQVQEWRYGEKIAETKNEAWNKHLQAINVKLELDQESRIKEQALLELQELQNQKTKVKTKLVTKEVIKYVQNPNAGQLVFPNDWVRIYDSAIIRSEYMQGDTNSTAELNVRSSTITDIDVLENATSNYAKFNELSDRFTGLRDWVRLECK